VDVGDIIWDSFKECDGRLGLLSASRLLSNGRRVILGEIWNDGRRGFDGGLFFGRADDRDGAGDALKLRCSSRESRRGALRSEWRRTGDVKVESIVDCGFSGCGTRGRSSNSMVDQARTRAGSGRGGWRC
jgi:hypothetical protein